MRYTVLYILSFFILFFSNCKEGKKSSPLFFLVDNNKAGINFINQLDQTEELNTYTFRNFYNGAGVGVGDINNDGLLDIYFCGNTKSNKLYLNKGNFEFVDITEKAGVACKNVWSTGVSMVDINADGWIDIYVCKSGQPGPENRHNELFINNGDLTFTEKAQAYGLNILGLSVQSAFFDYDKDGDLDCYLLNNSFKSVETFEPEAGLRTIADPDGANMLLRNDDMHFVDVTTEAGIYNSKIGFGLGATVSDINKDNWPDLYISNDFFERDYLYLNNHDGTFREVLEEQITETSMGAMGADIADINNDGFSEIYVTEMTAENHRRQKTKTLFQSWESYQKNFRNGYYHQFARNTLQLNNQNNTFSEIGRYAGIHYTDWSWGALIFDIDQDGYKDIFVANGIYKDLLDRDYLAFYANPRNVRNVFSQSDEGIIALIEKMPSEKVSNYAFINNQNLTFTNKSELLGLSQPGFSNGTAYADLDNDGDLDLVINNINMQPFLYRNDSEKQLKNNFITISLKGEKKNKQAIGSKVTLHIKEQIIYQELTPNRGFMSTVDTRMNFGLGKNSVIDSLIITWPDGMNYTLKNVSVNQFLAIDEALVEKKPMSMKKIKQKPLLTKLDDSHLPLFNHIENDFSDFSRYKLLFHMRSNEGPKICTGDINNDGKEDFYVCGAKDLPGSLFIQNDESFIVSNQSLFEAENLSEETDCIFFDADNDGDQDLYVASGSLEYPSSSSALIDKLYINDGKGNFTKSTQILPSFTFESTSCVRPADIDLDGDLDLFVGVRMKPFNFGIHPSSYILENNGSGNFTNITHKIAQPLVEIGHVTDASWNDIDNDGDEDLIIVGEWMPITLLLNEDGILHNPGDSTGLENSHGWWNVIKSSDLDGDGDIDFIAGNHGLNSVFQADKKHPVQMFVNDFDLNGSVEQIITTYTNNAYYPLAMQPDLVQQIPSLASKIPSFDSYKNLTLDSLFDQVTIAKSIKHQSFIMESSAIINLGDGKFELRSLPDKAQISPVYAVMIQDFDDDGILDVILGGNQTRAKPEVGIYNASHGLLLKGEGDGKYLALDPAKSGISIRGEVRDFEPVRFMGQEIIIVAKNNAKIEYLKKVIDE